MGSYIPFDGSDLPLSDLAGLSNLRPAPRDLYDDMGDPAATVSLPDHGYFIKQISSFIGMRSSLALLRLRNYA